MPNFIEEIQIKRFRGIDDLNIQDLSSINILVGDNNSGKTSVLEAIKILASPRDTGSIVRAITSRTNRTNKSDLIDAIVSAFKKDTQKESYYAEMGCIFKGEKITLKLEGNVKKLLDLSQSEEISDRANKNLILDINMIRDGEPNKKKVAIKPDKQLEIKDESEIYHAMFMPVIVSPYFSCTKYYPDVIKAGKKELFIKTLQIFDSGIEDISIIDDMIWVHHNSKQIMPLFSYGTGMQKALLISILLVIAEDGILLIDEIESAIHSKALTDIFKFVLDACKELNVQLFATTHSLEAVDRLLEAGGYDSDTHEESEDLIRIITLRENETSGKTTARVLTGKEASYKRETYEMELRL